MSEPTNSTPGLLTLEDRILRLEEAFVHYVLLQSAVARLNHLARDGHVDPRTGAGSLAFSQAKRIADAMSQEFENAFKSMVRECKVRRPLEDTLV